MERSRKNREWRRRLEGERNGFQIKIIIFIITGVYTAARLLLHKNPNQRIGRVLSRAAACLGAGPAGEKTLPAQAHSVFSGWSDSHEDHGDDDDDDDGHGFHDYKFIN